MTTAPSHVISGRTVPLNQLRLDAPLWSNPRQFTGLDDEELAELAASIKDKGIVEPLKVQRILINGAIVDLVIDGQRRVRAGIDVLAKSAPIPVVDLSEDAVELTEEIVDGLLEKAFATLKREGLSSFELLGQAMRWDARGKTGAYIANALGKSGSWVSRMLKAAKSASPKLMLQWRKGEVTDEQFKELAEEKDHSKQAEAVKGVVEARKAGDKAEARIRAKEVRETAVAEKKAEKVTRGAAPKPVTNGVSAKPVVAGPQVPLPWEGEAAKPVVKKPAVPSRAVLDDMLHMAQKKPPTHDYVKGMMDAVKYVTGQLEPKDFAKPWAAYLSRIAGTVRIKPAKAKKASKPRAAAKPAKKATARKAKTSTGKRKR